MTLLFGPQAQLLPLYILAALKHPVLKDGTDIRSDERIALITALGGQNP